MYGAKYAMLNMVAVPNVALVVRRATCPNKSKLKDRGVKAGGEL
jgi:hypothetical protein